MTSFTKILSVLVLLNMSGILPSMSFPSYNGYRHRIRRPQRRFLDMTYTLNDRNPSLSKTPLFILTNQNTGPRTVIPILEWFYGNKFEVPEHYGTHMDAPIHTFRRGLALHEIPFKRLHGPAVRINISRRAAAEKFRNATLDVDDIIEWESKHGRIQDGSFVMMFTGWGQYWNDNLKYLGGTTRDTLRFPGFSLQAMEWLIKNRPKITGIATDTWSCEQTPQGRRTLGVHVAFSRANLLCLENVANMDKLPDDGAELFALPIKIEAGSGGQVRIFAVWNQRSTPSYW